MNLQLFSGGGASSGLGKGGGSGNAIVSPQVGQNYIVVFTDRTGKKIPLTLFAKDQEEANKKVKEIMRINKDYKSRTDVITVTEFKKRQEARKQKK